jgi:hypothetical protein
MLPNGIRAANSTLWRLSAMGRIARLTPLGSISIGPSSTNRVSPSQRESSYRIAAANLLF